MSCMPQKYFLMINSLSEIRFDERKSIKKFSPFSQLPHSVAFASTIWLLRLLFEKVFFCQQAFLKWRIGKSRALGGKKRAKSLVFTKLTKTKNNISKNVFHL